MKQKPKWIIGIDEVGRGPLAGPVAVGVVCVPMNFDWKQVAGVGDSKKVSPKNREAIFRHAEELQKEGKLQYAVGMVSAKEIDKIGIVHAIQKAMNHALVKIQRFGLGNVEEYMVKLDGGLKAPKEYIHQETIIKGDAKEKVIGLASIMAKVTRDRYMVQKGDKPQFAPYLFAIHKGYGTKKHRKIIENYGLSIEHRKTFCRNILKK
jgi:ribonuclease HII